MTLAFAAYSFKVQSQVLKFKSISRKARFTCLKQFSHRAGGVEIDKRELTFDRGRLHTNRDIVVYINKEPVEEVIRSNALFSDTFLTRYFPIPF